MTINLGVKALLSWVSWLYIQYAIKCYIYVGKCYYLAALLNQFPNSIFMQVNCIKVSDQELSIDDLRDGTILLKVVHML